MPDVIHYNGQDKWKQKATELLNQGGGGGGGNVDDVKVDGVSVVDENKVAQIDLSDYATQSYVTSALDDYTTTAVLQANYYNKTEVNSRLADKADASTTYTKTEVDTALQSKANANSVYTKTEADDLLDDKANVSDVYAKSETYSDDEVDALLSAKADTADLATVATSGSYNDLSNKPTIPGDTTYIFSEGSTNGAFLVTPSGGTAQIVHVHGVLTSHQSVTDNNPTLAWNTKSKVATIGGTEIHITMPANPNTNTTYTIASGDGNGQIKVTPSSGSAYNVSVKGLGSAAYLTADTAASANTVVRRTANKYIYATYYNSNIDNEDANSYSNVAVMFTSDDKWIRRTSRLNFAKYLTNQQIASPGYFVTLTNSWGSFGYSTPAQARTGLGLGSMATQNTGSWEPIHPYLWAQISRNNVTQAANSNDYWTMTAKTFPARSGYSRYVPVINFSNNNIVCTKWEINSSNQVLIYTRNLASSSQTFNIYIVAMYLRDTKQY